MRLLFVDDEPCVLEGIERTLFMSDRDWDAEFANSGAEALDMLEDEPVDVIISDMRMPLMDGGQLLRAVRERWPRTVRIMLSGQTEQEAAMRALDVAHQFLSKPCDGDELVEAIDRSVELQMLMHNKNVQDAVGKIGALPGVPAMYARLRQLLERSDVRVEQIADIIRDDPAIAAKVLQLANSAFFHGTGPVSGINDAVLRIGFNMLSNLVLATEIFDQDGGPDVDEKRRIAVRASRIADAIVGDAAPRETVMIAALLADVGTLLPNVDRVPVHALKDFPSHAEIGAYLLGTWGLPGAIVEAVADHLTPARVNASKFDAVGVVHVAMALAHDEPMDAAYIERMGMADSLANWRETAAGIQ